MALQKVNPMKESYLLLVLQAVKEKTTHFHNVTISTAQYFNQKLALCAIHNTHIT